jgi:hypothetical protein
MNTGIIDERILQAAVAEAVPGLDEHPTDSFVRAAAAAVRPPLEKIVQAYRDASLVPGMRATARAFLQNMLDAEDL